VQSCCLALRRFLCDVIFDERYRGEGELKKEVCCGASSGDTHIRNIFALFTFSNATMEASRAKPEQIDMCEKTWRNEDMNLRPNTGVLLNIVEQLYSLSFEKKTSQLRKKTSNDKGRSEYSIFLEYFIA